MFLQIRTPSIFQSVELQRTPVVWPLRYQRYYSAIEELETLPTIKCTSSDVSVVIRPQ